MLRERRDSQDAEQSKNMTMDSSAGKSKGKRKKSAAERIGLKR